MDWNRAYLFLCIYVFMYLCLSSYLLLWCHLGLLLLDLNTDMQAVGNFLGVWRLPYCVPFTLNCSARLWIQAQAKVLTSDLHAPEWVAHFISCLVKPALSWLLVNHSRSYLYSYWIHLTQSTTIMSILCAFGWRLECLVSPLPNTSY